MATSTAPAATRGKTGPSTIVLKTIMAITGIFFVLFILAHMYGNLMILQGQEAFDSYAEHIRTVGEGFLPERGALWLLRIGLLLALVGHAWAAFALWARAGRARQVRYAGKKPMTYGSFYVKAMRWGGVALLLFVVFHLLHFTLNVVQINGDFANPSDRLVSSFQEWWAVLIYAVAVVTLGLHLLHGVWGAGMTLGLNTSLRAAERIRLTAIFLAVVVVVGFMIPPLLILFGIIP